MFKIDTIQKSEYLNVIAVWEASVRATHHFLKEEDIQYFKPLILNNYLDAVELRSARNEQNEIIGFLGVAEQNLEMLFIHPNVRGIGIGKKLLHYAINELKITNVDVNEQNEQAVGFYKHFGFEIINRSELDFSGKPFPILYMKLKKQT
ncbi:GNAT family N-acetyltransferase [Flavobacterium sediminilitoris]|uniref:GNAT family N-acetyltransferase n=1 Tax=Flavobacterium sediminilitoris TaxID=2024526 RepID=A0ABY4HL67_9FLAO|nr:MULTISPECIES: GNAT family N-acetyltransferase [Flavobacterium]UOX33077.1 GNAT family N-acetyltransferase [Flavobacterium sediminilitoris]